jgi:hypothetical protein
MDPTPGITTKQDKETVSKVFKNIILMSIGVMFMISATGVYLTIHHCNSEDTTALFMFAPLTEEPCEHHKNGCTSENSCDNWMNTCDGNHCGDGLPASGMPACCSDTVFFITVDDDFVRAESPEKLVINFALHPGSGCDLAATANNTHIIHIPCITQPPGNLHGKLLVFSNRQLLL